MIKRINIISNITDKTLSMVQDKILEFLPDMNNIDTIYIYIDSNGGSINALIKILEILEPYKEKIVTVALGRCKSAATFIFLIGRERYVLPECEFIMHRPAYSLEEFANEFTRITLPLLKHRIKVLEKDEAFQKKFLTEHNVPKDLIKKIFSTDNDVAISIKALLETNMATGICNIDYNI